MINKNILKYCSTLGSVGYLPAPGTCASALMMPIIFLLYYLGISPFAYLLIIIGLTAASYYAIKESLSLFTAADPAPIVLDECIGMLITFYGLPMSWFYYALGFLLFRVLDISKIFGIKQVENIQGPWGIIMDDVLAGIMANILMRFMMPMICG